MRIVARLCWTVAALLPYGAHAGGGPFGIDHVAPLDDRGIWARRNQKALIGLLLVGESGVAVWEGGGTRLGRTLWQSIDATVVGGASSEVLKRVFSRSRPDQTTDPNRWFQGGGNQSFPSGEVTVTSAIVTPLVLEYGAEHRSVYLLELLPTYDAIARVKVHGHWQSDVLAGFALGTGVGYLVHRRTTTPWVLSVMPHGIYVGLRTH
jgi:hypothetical protein